LAEIDFITVLGRLLREGALRDALAIDPQRLVESLQLGEPVRSAVLRLRPDELEFQAEVLLHKRFDLVKPVLPQTLQRVGDKAWPEFARHGRAYWPPETNHVAQDAYIFCRGLNETHPGFVDAVEWNRVRFACGTRRISIHLARTEGNNPRRGVQILYRRKKLLTEYLISAVHFK
jgi:hypothetical protein